jgi:hypothetical protein
LLRRFYKYVLLVTELFYSGCGFGCLRVILLLKSFSRGLCFITKLLVFTDLSLSIYLVNDSVIDYFEIPNYFGMHAPPEASF